METSTHTLKTEDPSCIEAIPKEPTEENAFVLSWMNPGEFLVLEQGEGPDGRVLPWETLEAMLKEAGYELTFTRKVNLRLKSFISDLLEEDQVMLTDEIRSHLYRGPNKQGPSEEELHDVLRALLREGKAVLERQKEPPRRMGYRKV